MRYIRHLLVTIFLLSVALFAAGMVADIYRRLKYPDVPRHEAVFFDIGIIFLLSFIAIAGVLGGGWLFLRRRKAVSEHKA